MHVLCTRTTCVGIHGSITNIKPVELLRRAVLEAVVPNQIVYLKDNFTYVENSFTIRERQKQDRKKRVERKLFL